MTFKGRVLVISGARSIKDPHLPAPVTYPDRNFQMNPSSPWWSPARHADRRPALLTRNRIQAAIRGWLAGEGFTEVDPAALAISPGNEAHLHGFGTDAIGNDGVGVIGSGGHGEHAR